MSTILQLRYIDKYRTISSDLLFWSIIGINFIDHILYFIWCFWSEWYTGKYSKFHNRDHHSFIFQDRGYELITLSCYKPDPYTYLAGFDTFISNLGFFIYGLFTFACVTVLINTLIAMLEETIEEIDDRADIEWKFARSKLYMEYIREGHNRFLFLMILIVFIFLGNTLPVPLNLCPSPTSIANVFHRIKRLIISNQSSHTNEKINVKEKKAENLLHINMGRIVNNVNNHKSGAHESQKEKVFNRKRSFAINNEKLTYKVVIERIVKRFLLYYKNSHIGLEDEKDKSEFREVKNDIASFRFEVSYQIDILEETTSTILQSMNKFDENLNGYFDVEQMKQHLNYQAIS